MCTIIQLKMNPPPSLNEEMLKQHNESISETESTTLIRYADEGYDIGPIINPHGDYDGRSDVASSVTFSEFFGASLETASSVDLFAMEDAIFDHQPMKPSRRQSLTTTAAAASAVSPQEQDILRGYRH